MEYNPNIYIELLKYDKFLKEDRNSLEEKDEAKYLKLLNHSVRIIDHILCQKKVNILN